MSNINTRRNDATTALNFGKLLAVIGWIFIALGGLLTLTLIGAIAGIPMILISHNLRQVFDLVDRIVVFRRGRIVASLRKDETDGNDIVSYITGVKGGTDATYA